MCNLSLLLYAKIIKILYCVKCFTSKYFTNIYFKSQYYQLIIKISKKIKYIDNKISINQLQSIE
jgi:hypothetical protein